jgi:PAS domain S-box-containing protein
MLGWQLFDLLNLPALGYWDPGFQISLILQIVIGTLLLPLSTILPFVLFQLAALGAWGNWLDAHDFQPPLLSTGEPMAAFRSVFTTLTAQEAVIFFVLRFLRLEMEKSIRSQQLTIKRLQTEISERKQAELALGQLEAIYRRAIDAAGAVPYILDHATFNLTFIGEGILSMTGYAAHEMTSQVWKTLVQEAFPRGNLAHLTYAEADRLTDTDHSLLWECDFRIRTRDGQTRWIADTSVKSYDEKSGGLISIGIKEDITARKHAEELQGKLITELERRNAELERFTYTLSHELKSPLITIRGFIGYLREDALAGNQQRLERDLQRITQGADHMLRLIHDLIQLLSVGRLNHEPQELPLRALVEEALELVHERMAARHIAVHIAEDLPAIYGDHDRLLEVLQNLLENAVKFMRDDQPEPRIEIGMRGSLNSPRVFHVRDNGIGIEPRFAHRVFNIFEKLDAKSEGTGVGLALVKRIIEVHGGKVWIESEGLGTGTAFCFTIPDDRSNNFSVPLSANAAPMPSQMHS